MDPAEPWPPAYDDAYLPAPQQRHWFPARETMAPAERETVIVRRLQAVVRWAWERSRFYRDRWTAAGVHPDHLRTLEDLGRFPVVSKA
ncbi:MAG TPA: phenylacetate--CoA ligase family protein, partial [bacterium]|nr:phenylacetate--CoA ligase family protein [bacterium]